MSLLQLNTKVFQTRVKMIFFFFQATGFARWEGYPGAHVSPWWAVGTRPGSEGACPKGEDGLAGLAGASFPGSKLPRVLHSGALVFSLPISLFTL